MIVTHLLSSRLEKRHAFLLLLVPEFHRVGFLKQEVRGLYRQWGISPRPEDILFSCLNHYNIVETVCNRKN